MPPNGAAKSLESWIWDAACSIRGAKDAPKHKDYILPLIFTKRLCDVFDDESGGGVADEVGSSRFPPKHGPLIDSQRRKRPARHLRVAFVKPTASLVQGRVNIPLHRSPITGIGERATGALTAKPGGMGVRPTPTTNRPVGQSGDRLPST